MSDVPLSRVPRGAATETLSSQATRRAASPTASFERGPGTEGPSLDSFGQALVETALVLPLLLLLIVGLFDIGRAVWLSNTLATAVREGSRYGVVHGALSGSPTGPGAATLTPPDTDTAIRAQVRNYATGVPNNLTVQSTWPDGNANRGSRIVVSASFPFTPILAQVFLGGGLGITMRSSSTLVIEQ